jgi:hypothetical protein
VFIEPLHFETMDVKQIGWMMYSHPEHTYRDALKDHLLAEMSSLPVTALPETSHAHKKSKGETLAVPTFTIVPRRHGYGNGPDRIHAEVLEIQCARPDSACLVDLLTTITTLETNTLRFIPYGCINLLEENYKILLQQHNEYLANTRTVSVTGLSPTWLNRAHHNPDSEKAQTIRDLILQEKPDEMSDPTFTSIEKTPFTESEGKWTFICTKTSYTDAVNFVDTVLPSWFNFLTPEEQQILQISGHGPQRKTWAPDSISATVMSYAKTLMRDLPKEIAITTKQPTFRKPRSHVSVTFNEAGTSAFPAKQKSTNKARKPKQPPSPVPAPDTASQGDSKISDHFDAASALTSLTRDETITLIRTEVDAIVNTAVRTQIRQELPKITTQFQLLSSQYSRIEQMLMNMGGISAANTSSTSNVNPPPNHVPGTPHKSPPTSSTVTQGTDLADGL